MANKELMLAVAAPAAVFPTPMAGLMAEADDFRAVSPVVAAVARESFLDVIDMDISTPSAVKCVC